MMLNVWGNVVDDDDDDEMSIVIVQQEQKADNASASPEQGLHKVVY
jgi:hypothetical protein